MPTPPFKVKAVFEYASEEPDDLKFPNGQIITVTEEEDDDWYSGEYIDSSGAKKEGIFPRNFVEKYEPAIPSRPTRSKSKRISDILPPAEDEALVPLLVAREIPPPDDVAEQPGLKSSDPKEPETPMQVSAPASFRTSRNVPTAEQKTAAPEITKSQPSKPLPPQVEDKPSGNSFRDRIAAFNAPAAAPITPFKAGASSGTGFIKKPFIAPPPSKNAYVPPPTRELPPQKVYRREEDPSFQEDQAIELEVTKPINDTDATAEDQPKPTSLKERIALLQKQQLEQANRHADAAAKKEKKKPPPTKRRVESSETLETLEPESGGLERSQTSETLGKRSVDFTRPEADARRRGTGELPEIHDPVENPPPPARELVSDTNDADYSAAGETEEAELSTEEDRPRPVRQSTGERGLPPAPPQSVPKAVVSEVEHPQDDFAAEAAEEEEEEEEEIDPEVRRRMEIRERMAKMSGGMGMMGIFGGAGGMPGVGTRSKPKPLTETSRQASSGYEPEEVAARAPPIPVMPGMGLSGMSKPGSKLTPAEEAEDNATENRPAAQATATRDYVPAEIASSPRSIQNRFVPPPLRESQAPAPSAPADRAAPPVPQSPEGRGIPPLPRRSTGLSDDGIPSSAAPVRASTERPQSRDDPGTMSAAPPVPFSRHGPGSPSVETSSSELDRRVSRGAAPSIPMMSPTSPKIQARAPPPPPPGQPPSRQPTNDSQRSAGVRRQPAEESEEEEEIEEYDGDYDTDIASSVKHKDALKSHARNSSLDDGALTDEATMRSPASPPGRGPPPLPPTTAPRDVPPPPLPSQAPTKPSRTSTDLPRAPPPVPPPQEPAAGDEGDDDDPYRHSAPQQGMSSPPSKPTPFSPALGPPMEEPEENDIYTAPPPAPPTRAPPSGGIPHGILPPRESLDRSGPPPSAGMPPAGPARQSLDFRPAAGSRRSMEQGRQVGEYGLAADIDLGQSSYWWTQENIPPPSIRNKGDQLLFEMDTSTSSKRGHKSTISKDVYILYPDYSQTTVTATFDAGDPSQVSLEQRHERPPPAPRQDQLEAFSQEFGARIAAAATQKQNTTVGDGSAGALISELLAPYAQMALMPIGNKVYGGLVYGNLGNASTQQHDEIRPGDIVTFRNAKFAGHKGGLHTKYAVDVSNHVAVTLDWDGTKKKIRIWEQGRDVGKKGKSKVQEESFRMGDLKSGEVRVWRVMGRKWIGWDK